MPLTPFPVEQFGGLNVYDDPTEIGVDAAVDLLNVDLNLRGRLRVRDGLTAVTAAAASNQTAMAPYLDASNNEFIVTADATTLTPYNLATGTAGTTQTAVATSNNSFARFGDTSNTRLYVAAGTLYRFNGSTWASVGSVPISPNIAAITANDNRLAIATGSTSRVHFSDAGAPETFGASNFVDLWPGDGESVRALVRWRDFLFAFKGSKFAVFTGTSLASDGSPIFNYRAVDGGRGISTPGQAVAGDEGVYFVTPTGIYLTTGDAPVCISHALDPWLATGILSPLPTISLPNTILVYHDRRLYAVYPITANATPSILVYDPLTKTWSVWQNNAVAACSVPPPFGFRGLYFAEHSSKKVALLDSTATTDLGTAITWRYQTGYSSAGGYFRARIVSSGERKKHFKTDIFGSGTVTHQVLALNARANDVADPGASVTLGTSPAVARGSRRRGVRGTYFAHRLSGTGPATINGLTYWLSEIGQDT